MQQSTSSYKGYKRSWYPPMNENSIPSTTSLNATGMEFSLISYNILAQTLCSRQGSQRYLTKEQGKWNMRRNNLLNEVSHYNSDLISLQECDFYDSFWKLELEKIGYETLYSQQFNCEKNYQPMPYGLLTGFKKDKFKLVSSKVIDFQKEILKDPSITDIEVYETKLSGNIALISLISPIDQPEKIIILSNTHLYWRPACNSVRVRQALLLLQTIQELKNTYTNDPLYNSVEFVMTGDFNTSPNDVPYILLTTKNPKTAILTTDLNGNDVPFEHFQGDHNAQKFWQMVNEGNDEEFLQEFPMAFIEEIKEFCALKIRETSSNSSDPSRLILPREEKEETNFENSSLITTSFETSPTDSVVVSNEQIEKVFSEQCKQRIRNIKACIETFNLSLPIVSLYTFYSGHCCEEDVESMKVHDRWANNDLPYTTYTPHFISTLDYIFTSKSSSLKLSHLLSIPTPQEIQEQAQTSDSPNNKSPPPVSDIASASSNIGGEETGKDPIWIPNNIHSSDHFPLGVKLILQ